ncbi:hypothetical protein [Streptomyces sp. Amel2xC10]|uniref:hypothetical protein n=1 Tax=Streptomyces sp. Amel2xC10 TaxID=1305826 RepID=UPI000A087EA4|nr:hypothetical protein [Streptomyces sp. Amel2xC10]SMF16094.1 hypothetical protein SAMN02745830_01971 [Streptomyces sp. Amel2xC10]
MTQSVGGPGEQGSVGVQIDHVPPEPGGAGSPSGPFIGPVVPPNLVSTPAQKKAAAQAIEDHIEPDTSKAGDYADDETGKAVTAFAPKDGDGWVTSTSLKSAHKTWGDQVKNLMNRLASEKAALRSTGLLFQTTDLGIGTGLRQTSPLDGY